MMKGEKDDDDEEHKNSSRVLRASSVDIKLQHSTAQSLPLKWWLIV